MQKTILTGLQPSGRVHIGNYFGAMKQIVDLQNTFSANDGKVFLMIVDYHALNSTQDAVVMRENILNMAIDYLAIGIDPSKVVIFQQSAVPAHTELCWIFDTITTMPYLMRAHAFKDAEAKNKEISVGKFNYPILMAADMLLYDTDLVPVGQDQKQHVEYARDIAEKFNFIFGDKGTNPIFKLPEAMIMKDVAVIPGLDGQKMSKSYGNTIPLFASSEEINKAVMAIVTDTGKIDPADPKSGIPTNVYNIHKLFRTEAELAPLYEANRGKYKPLKDALIADIESFVAPMRAKRESLEQDVESIKTMLKEGGVEANKIANAKISVVKKAIGVSL